MQTEDLLFFMQKTTPSFQQGFPVDPIFLPGIISSDTDSKYLPGFHYLLFAIVNPSKGETFPKLPMQVYLCEFYCWMWACMNICEFGLGFFC